jgi:hypothetical protein
MISTIISKTLELNSHFNIIIIITTITTRGTKLWLGENELLGSSVHFQGPGIKLASTLLRISVRDPRGHKPQLVTTVLDEGDVCTVLSV